MLLTLTDLPPELHQATVQRRLTTGQILIQQGEPSDFIFWVKTGQMRLVSFTEEQMVTHYFVDAGEFFSESSLYFDSYGCTAMAEMPTEIIAIPKEVFSTVLDQSPPLSAKYLATLTHRFQSVKTLLGLRGIRSARERLLHYLMQRRSPGEDTIILEKPLKAIASELALTPESLSRLLTRLSNEGVIERKRRTITISQEWLADMSE